MKEEKEKKDMKPLDTLIEALEKMEKDLSRTKLAIADNRAFVQALPFLVLEFNQTVLVVEEYIRQYKEMKKTLES